MIIKIAIDNLFVAFFGAIVIYLCVTSFNNFIRDILENFSNNPSGVFEFTFIFFIIFFIVSFISKMGLFVIKNSNN